MCPSFQEKKHSKPEAKSIYFSQQKKEVLFYYTLLMNRCKGAPEVIRWITPSTSVLVQLCFIEEICT